MPDYPYESTSDSQQSLPEQVRPDLEAATDTLSGAAGDLADTAKAELAGIKQAAESQVAAATEKAKSFADEHKNVAAQQIGGVSAALTRVADDLAADEQTAPVAGYARSFADTTRRASETLRGSSVDELIEMAQSFGRRQPVAFLGLAALAGFAAGRFMVATSNRPASGPAGGETYDADYSNAYGSTARGDEIAANGAGLANSSNGGAFK